LASITIKQCSGDQAELMAATMPLWRELVPLLEKGDVGIALELVDKNYTPKQRGALHVWCEMCAKTLNDAGIYRKRKAVFGDQEIEMFWTMGSFKEDVYKYILSAMIGLDSTEKQNTVNPSDVALVISKQYAENGLTCPPWPSRR